jgi:thioredoxin reductase
MDVAIIGAGASAIEAGALIHEAGGRPQVFSREEVAHFGTRYKGNRSLLDRIRRPNSVLGPGMKSRFLQAVPFSVRLLPERDRVKFVRNSFGPSSPWWILTRVWGRVPIFVQTVVVEASPVGSRVRLKVREQGHGEREIDFDHVIAGTGYDCDVDRLSYLDPGLRHEVRRIEKAPWLSIQFQSSVPGAYFIGPIVSYSFGPLFRFVSGAEFAAPVLARHLAGPVRALSSTLRRRVLSAVR